MRSSPWRPYRALRTGTAATAAGAAVLCGIATLGLVGAPAASAQTLPVPPTCTLGPSAVITCSETFTTSTIFTTAELTGWQLGAPVSFQVTGASGGASAGGTAGGQGGTVDQTWTPGNAQDDYEFSIVLGQNGGSGNFGTGSSSAAGTSTGGTGGTGGGPSGSGAGGAGGPGSDGNVLGDAGGGGGGASGVYFQDGYATPAQSETNLVALAPGGGGGSDGAAGGNGGQPGAGNGGNGCGGGAGSATAGGSVNSNCAGEPAPGSASKGGRGGSGAEAAEPASSGYGALLASQAIVAGGGGGGGGVYGGGGGGVDLASTVEEPSYAAGGGGGGALGQLVGSGPSAQATVSWQEPDTGTTTSLSFSPTVTLGQPVMVTDNIQPPTGVTGSYTGGTVTFSIDGQTVQTVEVNGDSASANLSSSGLSVGEHTLSAVFTDGAVTSTQSESLDVVTTPTITLSLSGTTGTSGGIASVVQGTDPTVTATLPSGVTGSVTFQDNYETWPSVPVVNGTASQVIDTISDPVGVDYITAIYVSNNDTSSDAGSQSVSLDILAPSLGPAGSVWGFVKNDAEQGTQMLEVNNNSTSDGGTVDIWQQALDGNATQANELWVYQPSSTNPGYGELVNQNSGLCLEVNGTNGNVDQWQCGNTVNQLWQVVANPAGGYSLQVLSTGDYVGATEANGDVGYIGDGNVLTMQSSQSDATAWTATANDPLGAAGTVWSVAKTGASTTQLLEVNGASTSEGGTVDTWQEVTNGGTIQSNELWVYQPSSTPGYGELVNQNSGLCLEINGTNGNIDQWQCGDESPNQLWTEVATAANGDSLQNLYTGQYLGTTNANGAPVSSGDGNSLTMQATQSAYTTWTFTDQS